MIQPQLFTRIAPTPSGLLHPGNGLSFLLTWAIARAAGGKILLRIDDLDKERYRQEYVEDIFRTLAWLGIDYDEGPRTVTDFETNWSQHLRLDHYAEALENLRQENLLFACECSRKTIRTQSPDGRYPAICQQKKLDFSAPNVAWRIQSPTPSASLEMNTWPTPKTEVSLAEIDAFVVRQKNDLPAYQLASLVDDESNGINFIVRGQDLWESTLSQLYLAQLLGKENFLQNSFFHHPLLLDEMGGKLSKSKGAGSLKAWREAGKSPEGLFALAAQQLGLEETVYNGEDLKNQIKSKILNQN